MSKLHAVWFNKSLFDKDSSLQWLFEHKIDPIKKVHETTNNFKYRIRKPNKTKKYYSKYITDGVLFIFQ